jgi:hypothetical protein
VDVDPTTPLQEKPRGQANRKKKREKERGERDGEREREREIHSQNGNGYRLKEEAAKQDGQ